eukprot:1159244-Pelagomonas_calceolata.AAC.2
MFCSVSFHSSLPPHPPTFVFAVVSLSTLQEGMRGMPLGANAKQRQSSVHKKSRASRVKEGGHATGGKPTAKAKQLALKRQSKRITPRVREGGHATKRKRKGTAVCMRITMQMQSPLREKSKANAKPLHEKSGEERGACHWEQVERKC